MDPNILLIILLAAPVIVLTVLRANAALVFLSLCLGSVLVQFVAADAGMIVASTGPQVQGVPHSQMFVNLVLLLLPVVLTTLIMIRSVRGKVRLAFNILPALGVSALMALLAVPLMSPGLTGTIVSAPLWPKLQHLQTLIIGVTTLLTLLFLWLQRPKKVAPQE